MGSIEKLCDSCSNVQSMSSSSVVFWCARVIQVIPRDLPEGGEVLAFGFAGAGPHRANFVDFTRLPQLLSYHNLTS